MHNAIPQRKSLAIRDVCAIGLCAAITALFAQISVPLPYGVPITLQTFAICLAAVVLGPKKGFVAALLYVLLGAIGAPVFSRFQGGLHILIGPTGGYILSFPLMAYIAGLGTLPGGGRFRMPLCLIIGLSLNFLFGTLMFCAITSSTPWAALIACVFPFIPTSILQAAVSYTLGKRVRSALMSL